MTSEGASGFHCVIKRSTGWKLSCPFHCIIRLSTRRPSSRFINELMSLDKCTGKLSWFRWELRLIELCAIGAAPVGSSTDSMQFPLIHSAWLLSSQKKGLPVVVFSEGPYCVVSLRSAANINPRAWIKSINNLTIQKTLVKRLVIVRNRA